jgi:hypothetical protein
MGHADYIPANQKIYETTATIRGKTALLCEKSLCNCGVYHWCTISCACMLIIFLPTNETTTTTKRTKHAAVEEFSERWRTTTTKLLGKSLKCILFWWCMLILFLATKQ